MPDKRKNQTRVDEETGRKSGWILFFIPNSKPDVMTCPSLPEYMIWLRLVIGGVYGLSLGLRGQMGGVGILFGLNVITFIPLLYLKFYLGANIESYQQSISLAGIPNAIALMLLLWIILFTMEHTHDEAALISSLTKKVTEENVLQETVPPTAVNDILPETTIPDPPSTETEF